MQHAIGVLGCGGCGATALARRGLTTSSVGSQRPVLVAAQSTLHGGNLNGIRRGGPISASHQSGEHLGQALGMSGLAGLGRMDPTATTKRFIRAQAAGDGDVENLVAKTETKVAKSTGSGVGGSLFPSVAVACLGAVLFGYHLGVVNGALEYLAKDLGIATDAAIQGWVVSITLIGATVGSFTGGALADKFGRTRSFQLDAIPLVVGTLLSATATAVQAMLAGRFLVGLGIGISSAIVPLYIAEIAPTNIRGSLGALNQLSICIGILLALLAGLPLAGNPEWWKTMFTVAVVPAALLLIGMAYAPESPRWLFQQGRKAEAEHSIKRLWGKEKVEEGMGELENSGSSSSDEGAGWGDLVSAKYRGVVAVGGTLFLLQQFAGINAVVYYSTAVFRKAGIKSDVAASALVGAANVFGTLVASSLMDKQGRKKLLGISYFGMALSMSVLALALSWPALAAYAGTLAVAGTVSYVLAFSLGAGPVPGLILPEIFPSRIRGKAVAFAMGVHWICNFFVGLCFLPIVTKYGVSSVYVGFAFVCLLAMFYINNFLIETKGKSLEEIERVLIPTK
jgi:sugar porter (SP) family MFS transporter